MPRYRLRINRALRDVDVPSGTPLLWVLRDSLGLRGTKYGCGVGICGACTVLAGREAVRSCQLPVESAAALAVTTIEGLSPAGRHPCQLAWLEEDVAQCGYCQPGMIVEAAALLDRNPTPSESDIEAAFSGHVCRCGTWQRLRRAVQRASRGEARA